MQPPNFTFKTKYKRLMLGIHCEIGFQFTSSQQQCFVCLFPLLVTPTSMPGRHNYTNISTSWSLPNEPSTNSKISSTKSEGLSTKSEGLSTRSEGLSTKIEGLSTKTEWLSTKSEGLSTKPEGLSTRSEELSAIPSEQTTVHTGRYSSSRNKMKAISLGTTLPLVIVFIAIIGYITYKKRR